MTLASLPTSFATPDPPSFLHLQLAPADLAPLGQELRPYLQALPDPRGRRGRRYELSVLLGLCLVGFCTGCLGYLSVARWARALPPETLQAFGLDRGRTPCAATWLNLFRVLDWDQVADQFHAWVEALPVTPPAAPAGSKEPEWDAYAVDGKTLRGSLAVGASTAHVVSVVAHRTGRSVREVGVAEKEGELTVAPSVLAPVLRPGRVFTGDALFTQRALCQQIRAAGSHYVLLVKDNQPQLRAAVEAVLGTRTRAERAAQQRRSAHTTEQGHGRIENRRLLLVTVTPAEVAWPGVAQVFRLARERYHPATAGRAAHYSQEVVYGITSLSAQEAGPATVLRLQRGHWSIENQVHWVLDTFFREDERRIREGAVARGVAALRRGALNLLRYFGGRSVSATADQVKANPLCILPLLGAYPEN